MNNWFSGIFGNDIVLKNMIKQRPIDTINLTKFSKTRFDYIDQLKKNYRWKYYFSDPNELFKILNSNIIVSGSFLLQYLLNENWDKSDLDIYIGSDATKENI